MAAARTPLARIRLLVLDVDGVLTDGRLHYGAKGEELKVFHVRDGLGLKLVMQAGIGVSVISGRTSDAVTARCRELGITHLEQGCDDKVAALERVLGRVGVSANDALCVVDDTSDIPLMRAVGHAVAVADAHPEVQRAADRVTSANGGRGAVREVCDWLLVAAGARG
ncbi:MAG TPA: HAD hydrolase family protein [Steroidobacteraceae bacterium]|nr:HAD hydrolase family protein [Steroidobacteraceae bacterium]